MAIPHFEKVDIENIKADFTNDKLHRSKLFIPFFDRNGNNTLCILGQNPSKACKESADSTLQYLEQFVFQNLPQYSSILMLNLFSRIDTDKIQTTDLDRDETNNILRKEIVDNSDFLLVYGASDKDGAYNFSKKIDELRPLFEAKHLFKIDIGENTNYPPHPGNRKIIYTNYDYTIKEHQL